MTERTPSRAGARSPATRSLALVVAVVAASIAVLVLLGLGDLTLGLIGVAAATGWLIAVTLEPVLASVDRRGRIVAAGVLAAATSIAGLAAIWGWSIGEGGALGPVAYLTERYGLIGLLVPVVAAAAAALRAR